MKEFIKIEIDEGIIFIQSDLEYLTNILKNSCEKGVAPVLYIFLLEWLWEIQEEMGK